MITTADLPLPPGMIMITDSMVIFFTALVVGHTCVQGLITDVSKSKSKVLRAQSNAELEELGEESCVPHLCVPLL